MSTNGSSTSRPAPTSREERLAAALRENLKRRKTQARERQPGEPEDPAPEGAEP